MYETMNINDIEKINDDVEIIDVRTKDEYNQGHLKNAKNIEMMALLFNYEQFLDKNKKYYIYCHSGARSANVGLQLSSLGYDIVDMGGYMNYKG